MMRVHHVAISTARFDRLRAFYVETLNLPVVGGFPEQQILFLDADGTTIELVGEAAIEGDELDAAARDGDGFRRRGWQHVAWEVADVDAAYAAKTKEMIAIAVSAITPMIVPVFLFMSNHISERN